MQPSADELLAAVTDLPLTAGALGLEVVGRAGGDPGDDAAPVGQRLAAAGISLSALQRTVDELVSAGRLTEVRGRELWDRGLPTAGTRAMGRYYVAAPP